MILGCIDVGSNTTRLLVADAGSGPLRELLSERVFTRIGRATRGGLAIPEGKLDETARVVREQALRAREAGAGRIEAVATAAIRDAPNGGDLCAAVEDAAGIPLKVLSGREEARLSFVGATCTLEEACPGPLAVVDVGGGSTEIAAGTPADPATWWCSLPVGSGTLADTYLRSDPPAPSEVADARRHAAEALAGVEPPAAASALAVGGTATSLHRLVGPVLDRDSLARAAGELSRTPRADLAARWALDPERVRLLPAGLIVLEAVAGLLGLPLRIARGGLREGVIVEMAGR